MLKQFPAQKCVTRNLTMHVFLRGIPICLALVGSALLAAPPAPAYKLVGVYDVQTGKRLLSLAGQTEWEADATAVSADGKLLASTGVDKQILVWEIATGKLRHQLKDQPQRVA